MKKQNRNAFAYVRQPNLHQNEDYLSGSKGSQQSPNQTMFNEIVGQMDQNLTKYLNRLVTKNEKQQQKKKSMQKSLNHQRTKSYADILVETPSNSKNTGEKGHSYRGSHASTQINNIFFSLNNSPTHQRSQIKGDKKSVPEKDKVSNVFLETLDSYISDLTLNKGLSVRRIQLINQQGGNERRSCQKTRENSSGNLKIIEKLEASIQRQRQLKIANQILTTENQKLKTKIKKNKSTVKNTLQDLYQYAQSLSNELKQEKRERRKLQEFISQFQSKFIRLRPQRKTSGARPRIQDYLCSETTEQDDLDLIQESISDGRSKSLKRKKNQASHTVKHSRISRLNIEELSAMLGQKNFEYDDDNDSENYQP